MDAQPSEITEIRTAPGTDKTEFAHQDTVGVYFPPNDPENPQEGWSSVKRWRGASARAHTLVGHEAATGLPWLTCPSSPLSSPLCRALRHVHLGLYVFFAAQPAQETCAQLLTGPSFSPCDAPVNATVRPPDP